jgi:hypothetical protein
MLCGNVFLEAGIGAAGLKALSSSNLYAAAGVAITSLALGEFCREDGFDPEVHASLPAPFTGGQCAVRYNLLIRVQRRNGTFTNTSHGCWGPINGFRLFEDGNPDSVYVQCQSRGIEASPSTAPVWDFLAGGQSGGFMGEAAVSYVITSISRQDGGADNCGNPPGSSPQIVGDPDAPLNPEPVEIPVPPSNGFPGFSVPLSITNFKIEKLLGVDGPLVSFDVGGVDLKIDFSKSPPEVEDGGDDLEDILRRIRDLNKDFEEILNQIKECACDQKPEFEQISLPFSMCGENPDLEFKQFQAKKGDFLPEDFAIFTESAMRGLSACPSSPYLLEESLILQGESSFGQRVFFTDSVIAPEIISVSISLEILQPELHRLFLLAGDQSEGKFGHLDFCLSSQVATSGGIFLWGLRNYFRLPHPHALGKIRVSLRPGLRFRLFDTGERIPPSLF